MSKKYMLEIYRPNNADDVWVVFESDTPFMAMSKGDILNPGIWDDSHAPMKVLKIVNVEHAIWDVTGLKHKIMIYTEEVEGTRELRLN